jgi:hypothetical protein
MNNNLLKGLIIGIIIGGLLGWFVAQGGNKSMQNLTASTQMQSNVDKATTLKMDMRKLWSDHIIWTRSFIVSAAYDNDDLDNVTQRLLKNQEDIGNAIKPYYGNEAGDKLTTLLKEHITTAADLVMAAKKGDKAAQNQANEKWYANANEIADFLSSANPNWSKDQTRVMMKEHLDLTKQAAVDILGNKYEAGIADFDRIHEQILEMADMLTEGIVKQFPDKFK